MISVTPAIATFGDCNIGEYYSGKVVVINQSDLPAAVVPRVTSKVMTAFCLQTTQLNVFLAGGKS
jgi:hypothetical protein